MPAQAPSIALSANRLARVKRAYTTRRIPVAELRQLLPLDDAAPRAGDVVLARVERVGKHANLEETCGRRAALFVGDEILVTYAPRYAPDQFEAHVPADLSACHLVAGGGVAAQVVSRNAAISAPTEIVPIGLLGDAQGQRLNVARHAIADGLPALGAGRPTVIASVGTSMNAGKTTSAAYLIRGLVRAGLVVGAAKITGTGAGLDPALMRDAGAAVVLDFLDAGHASTAGLDAAALRAVLERLTATLARHPVDAVVLEVADGLLQRETALLLRDPAFRRLVDGLVFSSGDAMGAVAGARWLRDAGLPVLALAGAMTKAPLACTEAAAATGLPVLGLDALGDAAAAAGLLARAAATRPAPAPQAMATLRNFRRLRHDVDPAPLLAEIAAVDGAWGQATGRQNRIAVQRESLAIPLRGLRASAIADRARRDVHESRWTQASAQYPLMRRFIETVAADEHSLLSRAKIVCLPAGHRVYPHVDRGAYYRARNRYHLVLRSSAGSWLRAGDEEVRMREGELWWFDNDAMHEAFNDGEQDRIHLIFDLLPRARAREIGLELAHDSTVATAVVAS